MFRTDYTCPYVLWIQTAGNGFRLRDSHSVSLTFPCHSTIHLFAWCLSLPLGILLFPVWPLPLSLAATNGISFDFSSSAYLDVSLRRVPLITLFYSCNDPKLFACGGFPIRKSADRSLIYSSPQLIAVSHVLLRLPMPRHSPYALFRLNFPICRCSSHLRASLANNSFRLFLFYC